LDNLVNRSIEIYSIILCDLHYEPPHVVLSRKFFLFLWTSLTLQKEPEKSNAWMPSPLVFRNHQQLFNRFNNIILEEFSPIVILVWFMIA